MLFFLMAHIVMWRAPVDPSQVEGKLWSRKDEYCFDVLLTMAHCLFWDMKIPKYRKSRKNRGSKRDQVGLHGSFKNSWPLNNEWVHSCVCAQSFSGVHQAPLPTELSRQEYWSGLLFLSLGDLSDAGIEPVFLVSSALAGGFFTTLPSGKLTLIPGISLKKIL